MPGQDVQLVEDDRAVGVDRDGVAQRHGVEPAHAAGAPGHGPELAAALRDPAAGLVEQLGRERPGSHAGRVGLHDADDLVHLERADAATGAGAAGHGVGGGHEGVGAVVEVQQRALGALEEDVVAAPERVLDEPGGVVEVRAEALAPGQALGDERLHLEGVDAHRREEQVLVHEGPGDALAEDGLVDQVLHPEAQAPGAVAVRGPDAAAGRAHLRVREAALVPLVERHVVRHDHVRAAADADLGHVDAAGGQHVQLADQRGRVDHHAVADHRRDVRVEHARRAELELEHLVADHHRVAGVVAALVADHHRRLLGEEVGGLPLALVPPLEADDHGRGHRTPPDTNRPRRMPGSGIDVSRVCPPELRRTGWMKVRDRLTGRTPRLPRAMVIPSIAGPAGAGLEDRASIRDGSWRSITGSRVADGMRTASRWRPRGGLWGSRVNGGPRLVTGSTGAATRHGVRRAGLHERLGLDPCDSGPHPCTPTARMNPSCVMTRPPARSKCPVIPA